MTGMRDSVMTRSMSPFPPRGTMTSTNSSSRSSSPTARRSVVSTTWTASAGRPASASPARTHSAIARFEWIASEPPRRMTALPALRQRPPASAVTFGRDS